LLQQPNQHCSSSSFPIKTALGAFFAISSVIIMTLAYIRIAACRALARQRRAEMSA